MTTEPNHTCCPKCQSEQVSSDEFSPHFGVWSCGSYWLKGGGVAQTPDCRRLELERENARLREENSKEYMRGRDDQVSATLIQSPTWSKDILPLREEVARLKYELAEQRAACPCNCHNQPSSKEAMGLEEHTNCGECIRVLLKEAEEMADAQMDIGMMEAVAAEREWAAGVCDQLASLQARTHWADQLRYAGTVIRKGRQVEQ
jgi:ribosomal protein L37AE/L43A